ncbi:Transposase for insertion sequence element ISRM3 [Salmonella enterica]|uniref:Mutator family transposase n=1 Tax=Salmonella enterica TaxID=28901 RepID=A0A379SDS4_SALER|nr:Transposase for insertion sequence element ISRM3 [Salmonella enterica]
MLTLNLEGKKEVLGLYLSESEGANFWLSVLSNLQNRGVEDILIACVDELTGFPDAINSIYSQTEVQLCIVQGLPRSWWEGSKGHIQLPVVEHYSQFAALPVAVSPGFYSQQSDLAVQCLCIAV